MKKARRQSGAPQEPPEKKVGKLTEKQQRFIEAYLISGNASDAARKAGYSPKTAPFTGAENLKKPLITAAIDLARKNRQQESEITQLKVLFELARIGFADGRQLVKWVEDGCKSDSPHLTDELAATIASIKIKKRVVDRGKGNEPLIICEPEVKTWNKTVALNSLGEHFGMFKGKGGENNFDDLIRALAAMLLPRKIEAERIER